MKSWTCIENCGACCKFDLSERDDISNKLTEDDITLINTMTSSDGWCKYLDRKNRKCSIYQNRPHFCRVDKFSTSFSNYRKYGDKFLIDCCKEHIKSVYGIKSENLKRYKKAILKKWIVI